MAPREARSGCDDWHNQPGGERRRVDRRPAGVPSLHEFVETLEVQRPDEIAVDVGFVRADAVAFGARCRHDDNLHGGKVRVWLGGFENLPPTDPGHVPGGGGYGGGVPGLWVILGSA